MCLRSLIADAELLAALRFLRRWARWPGRSLAQLPQLVVQGLLPKRPLDLLVLGAGQGSGLGSGHEGMVELGYQWQLNSNLSLQPTLQWIIHPGLATPTPPGILAAGLQVNLAF